MQCWKEIQLQMALKVWLFHKCDINLDMLQADTSITLKQIRQNKHQTDSSVNLTFD